MMNITFAKTTFDIPFNAKEVYNIFINIGKEGKYKIFYTFSLAFDKESKENLYIFNKYVDDKVFIKFLKDYQLAEPYKQIISKILKAEDEDEVKSILQSYEEDEKIFIDRREVEDGFIGDYFNYKDSLLYMREANVWKNWNPEEEYKKLQKGYEKFIKNIAKKG